MPIFAEKISATLASTGSHSVVMNPIQAMHGDLGIIAENDVLLALSFSGESDEIIKLIPAVLIFPLVFRMMHNTVFTGKSTGQND